jgi:hypothetical protein
MFTDKYPFYMLIKSKPVKYGIKVWVAVEAENFMPTTFKYTLARLMEQGRRSRAFELSKVLSVTHMELEQVLTSIIFLQVVKWQISF